MHVVQIQVTVRWKSTFIGKQNPQFSTCYTFMNAPASDCNTLAITVNTVGNNRQCTYSLGAAGFQRVLLNRRITIKQDTLKSFLIAGRVFCGPLLCFCYGRCACSTFPEDMTAYLRSSCFTQSVFQFSKHLMTWLASFWKPLCYMCTEIRLFPSEALLK